MFTETDILFIRKDGFAIDQLCVIRVIHTAILPNTDKVMEAFEAGVTEWVETTQAGKKAWEDSTEDLNIGDLVGQYDGHAELDECLGKRGIQAWTTLFTLADKNEIPFDRVLAHPSEEEAQ